MAAAVLLAISCKPFLFPFGSFFTPPLFLLSISARGPPQLSLAMMRKVETVVENDNVVASPRRLKPLVITMGAERQSYIEELFSQPELARHFESPVFSEGIPSRSLRNRMEFFRIVNSAGLLPHEEWVALIQGQSTKEYQDHPDRFFECLKDVSVVPNRKGSDFDVKLHYSVELWRKAKSVNRGRAFLACTLAHLLAMKKCVAGGFDFILEDNVRAPIKLLNPDDPASSSECYERFWATLAASKEWEVRNKSSCHLRYYGWLGSLPNIKWVLDVFARRKHETANRQISSFFPFPTPADIEIDGKEGTEKIKATGEKPGKSTGPHEKPGGQPIWGAYAYWISKEGLEKLLAALRNDVGAILWKGKRMRCYVVKPIDKVLPRQIASSFGRECIHVAAKPSFFRAPMLTSKLHAQWDPEFCKSTELQLKRTGLDWGDLWLTKDEEKVVKYHDENSIWLTMSQLQVTENDGGNSPPVLQSSR